MKKEAAIACLQQPLDNLVSLHFRPDAIVNTQGLAQVHEYFSVYQILWFGIDAPKMCIRDRLYIACGISGQIQHRAGMEQSAQIIAINTDPEAPINSIADYVITGNITDIIPKMIKYYKKNTK